MNIIKLILITLIIIEGLVLNVWAADFQIGNIVSGGSGCPNGAEHIISYSIQDNGKKLRFSFEGRAKSEPSKSSQNVALSWV